MYSSIFKKNYQEKRRRIAWEDVRDLVPSRAPIGQFLTKMNDRQFPELLQFCLNKCGEVTLDKLHFKSPRNVNALKTVNPQFNELKIRFVLQNKNFTKNSSITQIPLKHITRIQYV
jgi:hypothetical protein